MTALSPQITGAGRTGGPLYRGAAVVTTLTIREAVAFFLRSLPALAAIVGTRIYYSNPSQLAAYPCVRVKVTHREYTYNLAGFAGASLATVEVAGLGLYESQSVAIAEVVRNNYQGFRGVQSGVPVLRCLLGDETDDTTEPPDGSDSWIYEVAIDYEIYHRVPLPTSVTQTNC